MKTAREIADMFGECGCGGRDAQTAHSIECDERTEVARTAQVDALRFALECEMRSTGRVRMLRERIVELETP